LSVALERLHSKNTPMKPRKTTYIVHRWIGLIISVQLLAWSLGGLVFSILDIDMVHGDNEAKMLHPRALDRDSLPTIVRDAIEGYEGSISGSNLIDRGLGPFWEVHSDSGELIARMDLAGNTTGLISPDDASHIALEDYKPDAPVKSVELIEEKRPSEYRGGRLPAYRVDMDHPTQTHIYIDAKTGQIIKRRNRSWRAFDFFFMLHSMNYKNRDNFNHPLLTIASLIAIVASGTGLALWGWRVIPKLLRRKGKKKGHAIIGTPPE
jgi:uncharacterized membrane protein YkoI